MGRRGATKTKKTLEPKGTGYYIQKKDKWRKNWVTPTIAIGIDESYTKTGISLAYNGELKKVASIPFTKMSSKTQKRKEVTRVLRIFIQQALKHCDASEVLIVCEKIRTFSSPLNEALAYDRPIISMDYVKATGALVATIVDTGLEFGIKTMSVDTRSWKSVVLGTTKPSCEALEGECNPQKIRALKYVMSLGFESSVHKVLPKGARHIYDDDAADSACIALYPFYPINNITLYEET